MNLTGIQHVSILVSDMERAVTWYSGPLGLKEVVRPSNFVTPSDWANSSSISSPPTSPTT